MSATFTHFHDLYQASIVDGCLEGARQMCSPNHNDRPDEDDISLLVVHNISLPPGEFGGAYIEHFFANQLDASQHPYFKTIEDLQVSSHLFIRREGEVVQFVPFHKRAWHAGVSSFNGRTNCNDFSIGIELEGTDTTEYTDTQYSVLAKVTQMLLSHYPQLNQQAIAGHCDIAPGRKTDPGEAFDWQKYFSLIEKQ